MKIVAFITDRKAIRAILASMRKSAASAWFERKSARSKSWRDGRGI